MAALLTRMALIGLAVVLFVLATPANATEGSFDFAPCVRTCIANSDACDKLRPKCVCRAGKGFLNSVVECMASSCLDLLADVEDSFLDGMEEGCKAAKRAIGKDTLDQAGKYASDLYTNMFHTPVPANPTATTGDDDDDNMPTITIPNPTKGSPAKETDTDDSDYSTTTIGKKKPPSQTSPLSGESSPTEAPSPSTNSPAVQTNGGNDRGTLNTEAAAPNTTPAPTTPPSNQGGRVDDSPFGSPNRSGASKDGLVAGFLALAALPLAAAVLVV